jgi:flavodoxin
MKVALVYGSTHGKTRKVVEDVLPRLAIRPEVFDISQPLEKKALLSYDVLLVFCPTYGDEELQEDMESFLASFDFDLAGKHFVICELGNYYGYENFSFGAMPILRRFLLSLRAEELCSPLSLDSLPRLHWGHLHDWVEHLNEKLYEHVRS